MSSSSPIQLILTSSPDGPITAYDPISGAAVSRFTGSRSPRNGLALVGEASFAASHISPTTASGSIHLYNWWSSTAFHHLPVPEPVAPLAVTLDGSYIFAGGVSGNIHVLSLSSGTVIRSIPAHSKPVSCFRINADGSLLISGGEDGVIVVFPILLLVDATNTITTTSCSRFHAHTDSITAISCIGTRSSTILSSSLDCTCKIWSLSNNTLVKTVSFPAPISGLALDPTESEFFAAGSDGSIYRTAINATGRDMKPVAWEQNHGSAVACVAVADEGRSLVSASEDGVVWIWDVESEKVRMVLGGETGSISDMAVAEGVKNTRTHFSGGQNHREEAWLSGEVMGFPVAEMEKMLREADKDKVGAINMLESAIAMYEKLLEMILKEAKKDSSSSSSNGPEDVSDK